MSQVTALEQIWRLIKQRRRWERGFVVFECRKHIAMGNIFSPNFRWSNSFLLVDRWLYNVALLHAFCIYSLWWCFHWHENTWNLLFATRMTDGATPSSGSLFH